MSHPKVTQSRYEAALEKAVDVIFEYATYQLDWDWHDLAAEANLCYETVRRLGERITVYPRWQTFWKLAAACGLQMQFIDLKNKRPVTMRSAKLKVAG
jgi:hypothetical protein